MHIERTVLIMILVLSGYLMSTEHTTCATPQPDSDRELVIILHGWGRTAMHMRHLRTYFIEHGYEVFTPTLPTFFRSVADCADILDGRLMEKNLDEYDRIHFVGHSMGGLIIRRYLADHELSNLGRCVLIGTPNGGTDLAKVVKEWFFPLIWISPALNSFQPGGKELPPPQNNPQPIMGAIAGTKTRIISGWLIGGVNDGMVPVASVPFPGMDDFIELPFHHDELPYRDKTAEVVECFIRTGRFPDNDGLAAD